MSLLDKRVVIIGGSSGIGLATAKMAVSHCASVIIASRSRDKLEKARAGIGADVEAHELDFTDESALRSFFGQVGPFDHLVTSASDVTPGPFLSLPTPKAREAFDSKFWGQYNAAKHAAPLIRDGGSIVLFSGIYAHRPPPGVAQVAAINGAVEALGRALAVELAPLRVNVVSPGLIDTPIWDRMPPDKKAGMFGQSAKSLPIGRIGRPEDVAHAVIFLMANGFTTGSTVHPDGGHTLR